MVDDFDPIKCTCVNCYVAMTYGGGRWAAIAHWCLVGL